MKIFTFKLGLAFLLIGCVPNNAVDQQQTITIQLIREQGKPERLKVIKNTKDLIDDCGVFEYQTTITRPPAPSIDRSMRTNPDYIIDLLQRRVIDLNSYIDILMEDYRRQYREYLKNCIE